MEQLQPSRASNRIRVQQTKSMVQQQKSSSFQGTRRRISKACNYCRQRKIKCNGNSPCVNCKSHSVECVYTKTIRKKKRTQAKKLTLQDLDRRMNKMDENFGLLNDKLSQVISILAQNKLADKSILEQQNISSNMSETSMLSDGESFDEDYGDQGEDGDSLYSDEETGSRPRSPIETGSTSTSSSASKAKVDILTPPDDEFQFLPRQIIPNSYASNILSEQFVPQYTGYPQGLDGSEIQEQLSLMENKMMLSFDAVNQIEQQVETDQMGSMRF